MRTPLLRHEVQIYRAQQRARAIKFGIWSGAWLTAGMGIGSLAAENMLAVIALFGAGMLLGFGFHTLTRPTL